jgi:cytochrome P450
MTTIETPPPPGKNGLPLLGETLSFAKNPFRFIEERLATHGRIFRSHILGRKAVIVAGPEAAGQFIDPNVIMREGAMPPHVQELFGGRSLPLLDGEVHSARKKLVNQAFNRAAMSAYLPIVQQTVETYFHSGTRRG